MSSNENLSPEEKLLNVIQQRKEKKPEEDRNIRERPDIQSSPVASPASPVVPGAAKAAGSPVAPATTKTSASPAVTAAPAAASQRAPAVSAVKPAVAPERKLKLASATEPDRSAKSAPLAEPQAASAASAAPAGAAGESAAGAGSSAGAGMTGGFKGVFDGGLKPGRGAKIGVTGVNRFLSAIGLVLFALVVYSSASWKPEATPEARAGGGAVRAAEAPRVPVVTPLPPFAELADAFGHRNPFDAMSSGHSNVVAVAPVEIRDLKLLGVSWDPSSAETSEALIRDEKTKKTLIVRAGDAVGETGFVVGKIGRDQVTVIREGKETKLR